MPASSSIEALILAVAFALLLFWAGVVAQHIRSLKRRNVELERELTEYRLFVWRQHKQHLDFKPVEPHAEPLDFLVAHKRGKRERKGS